MASFVAEGLLALPYVREICIANQTISAMNMNCLITRLSNLSSIECFRIETLVFFCFAPRELYDVMKYSRGNFRASQDAKLIIIQSKTQTRHCTRRDGPSWQNVSQSSRLAREPFPRRISKILTPNEELESSWSIFGFLVFSFIVPCIVQSTH